jgi:hypothetical protein
MNEQGEEFEPEELNIASVLMAQQPKPTPSFANALRRKLASSDRGYTHRPKRLWLESMVLCGAGSLFVLVGLLFSSGTL